MPTSTALILGAKGQIGTDLVPYLRQTGFGVHTLDRKEKGESTATHTAGDATEEKFMRHVISEIRPKLIFQLVAILSGNGEKDPPECWRVNMESLRLVLQIASETPIASRPRVIWPSSIAAFGPLPGDGDRGPAIASDETPLHPRSMYGATKAAGEALGTYYCRRRGVSFRSVRFPGLLSKTPPEGRGSSDFANNHYLKVAGHPKFTNATNFASSATRIPFMYMADAIRGLVQLAVLEKEPPRCTYNIAGFSAGPDDFAASIRRHHPEFRIAYVPDDRQANLDSWPQVLDDRAAKAEWGWLAEYDHVDKVSRRLIGDISGDVV